MGSTTRDGIQYTGKCGCGAIEFEMAEGADAAVIAPNCACNDCVSSAHWCDKMAKAKGVKNISAVEEGNPQFSTMVMLKPSLITVTKGHDKLKIYKLRAGSKTWRSYCSHCHTGLFGGQGPDGYTSFGIPCNRAVLQPPMEARSRTTCSELVNPAEAKENGLPFNQMMTWTDMGGIMGALTLGTGGMSKDDATKKLFLTPLEEDTEVMPIDAYTACGFNITPKA